MDFSAYKILSKHSKRRASTIYSIVAPSAMLTSGVDKVKKDIGTLYTYFFSTPLHDSSLYLHYTSSRRNIMGCCTTTTLLDVNLNGWGLYLHIKDLIYEYYVYVQVDYKEVGRGKGRIAQTRYIYSYVLRYMLGDTLVSVYMSINTLKKHDFFYSSEAFCRCRELFVCSKAVPCCDACPYIFIVYIKADMHYSMCDNRDIFLVCADKLEYGTVQTIHFQKGRTFVCYAGK